jgi:two-component system CheB/CheR fusion protein
VIASERLWVDADGTRLLQIIDNLVGNALKFTSQRGRVELTLCREGEYAVLSVKDSGVGIAPEMRERLFEPFVQAPQDLARTHGGLGLGLALVKSLVQLHGGHVEVASPGLGRGFSFTVRLPLVDPPSYAARRGSHSTGAPQRVLLIEDSEDAAQSLRELLALEGHEVRVAHDGPTGIALAREFHPTVVLCGHRLARNGRLLGLR